MTWPSAIRKVIGITPAMREGSGLVEFSKRFPDRYFDVAIAEQHAVTFAAGLAAEGLKPVVAIYSTFLQRAYDQLIHDVALQNLPVVFAIDRAGLVGGDGATHQGSYDISFMRCIPNLTVMTPADENECRQMLFTASDAERPLRAFGIRAARARAWLSRKKCRRLPVGKGEIRREGRSGLALLAFGPLLDSALKIAERLDATVVNMRFVKPLDEALVLKVAVTPSGARSRWKRTSSPAAPARPSASCWPRTGSPCPLMHIGIPDRFIEHGSREECLGRRGARFRECGRGGGALVGASARGNARSLKATAREAGARVPSRPAIEGRSIRSASNSLSLERRLNTLPRATKLARQAFRRRPHNPRPPPR